jgi:hypothetical protein
MTRRAAGYLWAAPASIPSLLLLVCTGARATWRDCVLDACPASRR